VKHAFTETILAILTRHFEGLSTFVFENSPLLQYVNIKTRSANKGSKSRSAFANHYALYVLIEDYIQQGFLLTRKGEYEHYEGARFMALLQRQRSLPFGAKLQNHALNTRLNDEFTKYFPTLDLYPILRDQEKQRYWINERLLIVKFYDGDRLLTMNIAQAILDIIESYIAIKQTAFEEFLRTCKQIALLPQTNEQTALAFIQNQLQPNVDARIFEIISFAILKTYYGERAIFWGWAADKIQIESLILYKTGRTNANDGGIDFVMKPLGRFFQVTETMDVSKYFLDIDKIQRFPLTFIIKTNEQPDKLLENIRQKAFDKYGINTIVERYMQAIEQIINIPQLLDMLEEVSQHAKLRQVMNEIILHSQNEFNYLDALDADGE